MKLTEISQFGTMFTAMVLLLGVSCVIEDGRNGEPRGGESVSGENGSVEVVPEYLTQKCGTMPVNDLAYSMDSQNPTVFEEGMIVGGRIDPKSPQNYQHFWDINLEAGSYHLVVDTETSSQKRTNVGLKFTYLDEDGQKSGSVSMNEIDSKIRFNTFFTIPTKTVRIRIEPNFGMEDYHFMIVRNEEAVPSPTFFDCKEFKTVSLGESLPFRIDGHSDSWFLLDADIGDYQVKIEASREDGRDSNIGMNVNGYDLFGAEYNSQNLVFVNEIERSIRASGVWNLGFSGKRWIRVRASNSPLIGNVTIEKL